MAITYSTAHQNARLDQFTSDCGAACQMRIYDGTPPATVRDALAGNTLLATLPMANPIAPAAANGVLTLTTPFSDPSPGNSGVATFYRIGPAGTDIQQGTIGLIGSGADLEVDNASVTAGFSFTVNTGVINEGN